MRFDPDLLKDGEAVFLLKQEGFHWVRRSNLTKLGLPEQVTKEDRKYWSRAALLRWAWQNRPRLTTSGAGEVFG